MGFGDTLAKLIEAIGETLPDGPFGRLDVTLEMCLKPAYGEIRCGLSPKVSKDDVGWLVGLLGPPSYFNGGCFVWRFSDDALGSGGGP